MHTRGQKNGSVQEINADRIFLNLSFSLEAIRDSTPPPQSESKKGYFNFGVQVLISAFVNP